jgi:hypothetical protein
MYIRDFFKRFRRGKPRPSILASSSTTRPLSAMVTMVAKTQAQELSCDEAYALLDVFADRVSRGEDAAALMPLVQHHLEMCPDCREEFTALLRAIESIPA